MNALKVSVDPFVAWNVCLLRAFFSPASAGEETWLAIDPDELDAIGPHLGGDEGFLDAVRKGPPWNSVALSGSYGYASRGSERDFAARACGLARQRQRPELPPVGYIDPGEAASEYAGRHAPSYLPLLAALVRACADQTEEGYYACLQKSLGLSDRFGPNEMRGIETLWSDLESWTKDCGGAFGCFVYRQLGGYRRIGIPRSQSIMSRRDVQLLSRVFAEAGLTPGQPVSPRLLEDVKSIASEALYLSSPFRAALAIPDLSETISERLRTLLDEWDGVVIGAPESSDTRSAEKAAPPELGVALALGLGNALPWEVRWRAPGIRDTGSMLLRSGGDLWRVRFSGEPVVTAEPVVSSSAAELLDRSASEAVVFEEGRDGLPDRLTPGTAPCFVLTAKRLRTLVGEAVPALNGEDKLVLVERDLPAHGPAYLLSAPTNVDNVRAFLSRNYIRAQDCPADGLPAGWLLVYVPDCARIADAQRNELPDGLLVRSRPRVLRLVGGCQIRRAGRSQFLSYDLPHLELDAPLGVEVRANGLVLREQPVGTIRSLDSALGAVGTVRHFSIEVDGAKSTTTDIHAVRDGQVLDTVRLRIAPDEGLGIWSGDAFSLDPQGVPMKARVGLRGALLGTHIACLASAGDDERYATPCATPGEPLRADGADAISGCGEGELLDALAQVGALSYGAARDLLQRSLSRRMVADPDVSRVMRSLSARGMLEIETDVKGRWIRVHAVPPTLCLVPARTFSGRFVACIVGSLRLQHWRALASPTSLGVQAYAEADADSSLAVLRLAAGSIDELRRAAAALQLQFAEEPARAIATWSASIADVRDRLERTGVHSLGRAGRSAERFSAGTGRFVSNSSGVALDAWPRDQLFRLDDTETGGRYKLHSLGYRDADDAPRYAFVRDWRWGVWVALTAFGESARDQYAIADACPWPFQYSKARTTLWLPARIRLPAVLERALVLCSGRNPTPNRVTRREIADRLIPEPVDGRGAIGSVSRVYDGFLPRGRSRAGQASSVIWLGYNWVPEDVAATVAARLGGCLRQVDE